MRYVRSQIYMYETNHGPKIYWLGVKMDKLINKVEKDVRKPNMKKFDKDIKTLKKADKKFDAKLDKRKIKH
jgi:predicted transcriptional regulator